MSSLPSIASPRSPNQSSPRDFLNSSPSSRIRKTSTQINPYPQASRSSVCCLLSSLATLFFFFLIACGCEFCRRNAIKLLDSEARICLCAIEMMIMTISDLFWFFFYLFLKQLFFCNRFLVGLVCGIRKGCREYSIGCATIQSWIWWSLWNFACVWKLLKNVPKASFISLVTS